MESGGAQLTSKELPPCSDISATPREPARPRLKSPLLWRPARDVALPRALCRLVPGRCSAAAGGSASRPLSGFQDYLSCFRSPDRPQGQRPSVPTAASSGFHPDGLQPGVLPLLHHRSFFRHLVSPSRAALAKCRHPAPPATSHVPPSPTCLPSPTVACKKLLSYYGLPQTLFCYLQESATEV